jgi:GPH family glycoside/pentoside/hexuronide:cation symporter
VDQTVPFAKKLAYAAPAFALAVVGIPIYVFIPKFYTDVVGVSMASVGVFLLAVRLFDAVSDPLMGLLSDRSRTRFGRRRPYLALGSVLLAISLYLLFNPPEANGQDPTKWFGLAIFAVFLFWTIVVVPYESLGPEITFDYDDRTSLFAFRDGLLIAGTLAAASAPAAVQWAFGLPSNAQGERDKFFWISVLYAPLLIVLCWWCVFSIKETPFVGSANSPELARGLRGLMRNRPFLILLTSYTVAAFGSNLPATLILYYVEYVLDSQYSNLFLMIYFITGIIFLPAWIRLSKRFGKKAAWLLAMALNTGAFLGVFFLGPGDEEIYGILVFSSGIGFGATIAIPSAMQADVIDYDELLSGERREGQYVGVWSIARKLAAALGVGVALQILAASGYAPNSPQSEQVRFVLSVLYALVPCICNLVAFLIAMTYPITSEVHREIRAAIDDRKRGEAYADPLKPLSTRRTYPDRIA